MKDETSKKTDRKDGGRFTLFLEIAILAIVTPALIYAVGSLSGIPIV